MELFSLAVYNMCASFPCLLILVLLAFMKGYLVFA